VPTKVGAVLRALARLTAQVCAVDRCSIFVRRDDVLLPAVSELATGRSDPALWQTFANLEVKIGLQAPTILAEMLRDRRPRLIIGLSHEPGIPEEWKQFGAATILIVPLLRDADVVGLLVLDTSASVIGPSERRRARQIAGGISLVVDSAAMPSDMRSRIARDAAQAALDRERMRVDQILHDGARQTVFSMAMKIELALMGSGKTSALRPALRALKQDAATLMAQMRGVVPRTDK
jgi:signal transduction histidine kinase